MRKFLSSRRTPPGLYRRSACSCLPTWGNKGRYHSRFCCKCFPRSRRSGERYTHFTVPVGGEMLGRNGREGRIQIGIGGRRRRRRRLIRQRTGRQLIDGNAGRQDKKARQRAARGDLVIFFILFRRRAELAQHANGRGPDRGFAITAGLHSRPGQAGRAAEKDKKNVRLRIYFAVFTPSINRPETTA